MRNLANGKRPALLAALVLAWPGALGLAQLDAGAQATSDPVVLVYDATTESECEYQTRRDDRPATDPKPCPSGMIIAADYTTSDQVGGGQEGGSSQVVPITGDEIQDQAAIDAAMDNVAELFAPPASGQGSCIARQRWLGFSLKVGGERARINLEYDARANCNIVNVYDRAKAFPESNGQIDWLNSCVRPAGGGSFVCKGRGGQLFDNWRGYNKDLPNTTSGKEWRTNMEKWSCGALCTTYRAYWFMD